jgi:glycosyltransferase involved in cell wall biosynthesis
MPDPPVVLLMANFADRVGGGEESLLALARGLDRHRFAPHAAVPGEGQMAEELRRDGLPVAVLPLPPLRPWTFPSGLRTIRRLRRLLGAWRVATVHAHGSRSALYAGLAAWHTGVPLIWHVRIVDRDPLLDATLLALSTRVIAISQAVAARFRGSSHAGKVRVVPNGVDPEFWRPAGRCAPPGASLRVLLAGRFTPEKGQATLLRAAPAVLRRFPATRFILMGTDPGDEAGRLRALASGLGVGGAVEVRAWMADPRPAYQEADVVVLPSCSEGFGRALVEAGCLEKPVVASRVGGIPEVVVEGETGILVPPEDPGALAEALVTLLSDPALRARLGAAGRRRAARCFTVRQHVERVEAIYAEVLAATDAAIRAASAPPDRRAWEEPR